MPLPGVMLMLVSRSHRAGATASKTASRLQAGVVSCAGHATSLLEVPMWRFLLAPPIAALALGMLAQTSAPPSDQQAESANAPCTVAGRVVTAAGGEPLKSARVALVPEHSRSSHPHIYATISEIDGHFLLKDVAPGRYQFFATRTGFVDQQYQSEAPIAERSWLSGQERRSATCSSV
jgi:Carboxypeptidase regulatory-like domain